MFGLGFWEVVVIAVVALLFIGPDKMPNFFRALGRATREFQRASRELRANLEMGDLPVRPDKPAPKRPPPPRAVDVPTEVVSTRPAATPAPAAPDPVPAPTTQPTPVSATAAAAAAPERPRS
jgi:sec-independent protein translocase protein TatB